MYDSDFLYWAQACTSPSESMRLTSHMLIWMGADNPPNNSPGSHSASAMFTEVVLALTTEMTELFPNALPIPLRADLSKPSCITTSSEFPYISGCREHSQYIYSAVQILWKSLDYTLKIIMMPMELFRASEFLLAFYEGRNDSMKTFLTKCVARP